MIKFSSRIGPGSGDEATTAAGIFTPGRILGAAAAIGLLGCLALSGVLSRGYESKTIRFAGIGSTSHGSSMGSKRVFLRAGQTFVVDYDVQIEYGGLYIRLHPLWHPPGAPSTETVKLQHSGSGRLEIPIPATGVYALRINGSPDGRGYHVSYDVSWRPGAEQVIAKR